MPAKRGRKRKSQSVEKDDDEGEVKATKKSPYFTSPPKRADFSFFDVDAVSLARKLLGQTLVSTLTPESRFKRTERTAGIIVETEAYPAGADEASHSFDGKKTKRNEALYNPPGTFYVFYCYGRLSLCNISSNEPGAGVLIRALEPSEGIAAMLKNRDLGVTSTKTDEKQVRNLCNGPAKLSQALGITRENGNNANLVDSDKIFLEVTAPLPARIEIHETTRIGIDYAGKDWRDKLWRFYVKGSKFISRK